MVIRVRPARAGDGEGCAAAWVEAAGYYAALDPARFVVPDTDGLAEFFEDRCAAADPPDQIRLVAENDDRFAGFLTARMQRPHPQARYQFLRHATLTTLSVDALVVAEWARRTGVATALMTAAHQWGADRDAALAMLDAGWSRCASAQDRRDDAVVALEDQVVDVGRRYGTHGGQLCCRLLLVEHVERPIADCATLQMRVVSCGAVEGTDDDRVDTGSMLLWP
jgi:GNAT superfamily N-acetyltransferase